MSVDAKENVKKLRIAIGIFVIVLLLAVIAWILMPSEQEAPTQSLGVSDPMEPVDPPKANPQEGKLSFFPTSIVFGDDQPGTAQFSMTAQNAPVTITSVVIPSEDDGVMKVKNIDCPVGVPLQIGQSCSAAVTWDGTRSLNSNLIIQVRTTNNTLSTIEAEQRIQVAATTTNPQAASPNGANTAASPELATQMDGGNSTGGVSASAVQNVPAATVAPGPSPRQMMQASYLNGRRSMGSQIAQPMQAGQLQPAARSAYTSWDANGVQSVTSTRPTDMARVLTPDKPISAVISVPIDTRVANNAIAMVDRDVYGNNGRTIVIPRGSKLVGKVSAGDTRVIVAWNQLIRPDGARFLLIAASGDQMGKGGIPGRVNERLWERYRSQLLSAFVKSGIAAGLKPKKSSNATGNGTISTSENWQSIANEEIKQSLDTISEDYFQRKINIPVQITIAAGTRITIWPETDLRLKPIGEKDDVAAPSRVGSNASSPFQSRGGGFQMEMPSTERAAPIPQEVEEEDEEPVRTQSPTRDFRVGQVDANGNYVPPRAPAAGPLVTTPQARSGATATPRAGNASGAATSGAKAPWER